MLNEMARLGTRRQVAIVIFLAAAAAVALFFIVRPSSSLAEQAQQLHEVEPYAIEGMTVTRWTRDGVALTASYEGGGARAEFELALWPTEEVAFRQFAQRVEELSGEQVDDPDALEGREPCFRDGRTSTCVGYDGYRTFEAIATTLPATEDELDARLLIRAARKHWYRVMGEQFE